jgi:hypothetical protein
MYVVQLHRGTGGKKYSVHGLPVGPAIQFGDVRYEDYTQHRDKTRRANYLARHAPRENWTVYGAHSAGFWARWLLWNKKTLPASIRDIRKRFGIVVDNRT